MAERFHNLPESLDGLVVHVTRNDGVLAQVVHVDGSVLATYQLR